MAYPSIISSTGMSSAGNSGIYSITLPATINAGNTILIVMGINSGAAITPPAGYTEVLDTSPGAAWRLGVYKKTADGTEDGTSVSFTNGSSGQCNYQAYALDSTDGTVETATPYFIGLGANDPPSITPSWSGDTLYLAWIFGSSSGNPSAAPSGYSGYSELENASQDSAIAYKTGTGTENPGAFTASSSTWACLTVAIKGAVSRRKATLFAGSII